jgi:hypothetical protein
MKLKKRMRLEDFIPKFSSFIPGRLAPNIVERWKELNLPISRTTYFIANLEECARYIPTAMTAYGKQDYELLYALIPYVVTTYILDRTAGASVIL